MFISIESFAKYIVSAGVATGFARNIETTNPDHSAAGAITKQREIWAYVLKEPVAATSTEDAQRGYRLQIHEKDLYTVAIGSGIEYYKSRNANKAGMTGAKYLACGITGKLVNSIIPQEIAPSTV